MSDRPRPGQRIDALLAWQPFTDAGIPTSAPLMVVFYRGLWCDYCREQLDELAGATARFTQRGVGVVAISSDTPEDVRSMLERTNTSFPIISDSTGDLIRELDLVDPFEFRPIPVSLPAVFLIDGTGVVRFHYVGRSPDDRPQLELLLLAAESLSMETH